MVSSSSTGQARDSSEVEVDVLNRDAGGRAFPRAKLCGEPRHAPSPPFDSSLSPVTRLSAETRAVLFPRSNGTDMREGRVILRICCVLQI